MFKIMDKNNGWIKLHRSLYKWEWYDDINATRVLIHLLLTVNHKDSKYKGHVIKAGSRVMGIYKFSEEVGLSAQQTRTAIKKVKESGEITIKATNQFSIISLTKWQQLQSNESINNKQDNKPITNEQQTDNKRITTSKERKEVKKEKKDIINNKKFSEICSTDSQWLEIVSMQNKTNPNFIKVKILEFDKFLIGQGEQKNSGRDYKSHFSNWLPKNIIRAIKENKGGRIAL